jgi:hypothetical protein
VLILLIQFAVNENVASTAGVTSDNPMLGRWLWLGGPSRSRDDAVGLFVPGVAAVYLNSARQFFASPPKIGHSLIPRHPPEREQMKKICLTTFFAVSALGVFTPRALADGWDKLTEVTFSGPVEVPGKVLLAGTYIFKLLDSPSDRNIVQIYNADQTKLEDMVLAIPDQRLRPTGKVVIQFSERPSGSPPALKAWFYPGSDTGIAFVYPHDKAAALAKANKELVLSTRSDLSPYATKQIKPGDADAIKVKSSPVKTVQPNGEEKDYN